MTQCRKTQAWYDSKGLESEAEASTVWRSIGMRLKKRTLETGAMKNSTMVN